MTLAPLDVFIVAGESSGDALGARLMASMRRATAGQVTFTGVGGPGMTAAGLESLFPVSDIAVMGLVHIIPRLRTILRRLDETVAAIAARMPDVLVVIDSPEFTQRLAKRVRARYPNIVIIKYVAPQIWAWRRGRGKRMRRYIDHVLALLPFEPDVYDEVGGPPTTYVGHPLIEMLDQFQPNPDEAAVRSRLQRPTVVVLPGSRISEVSRLLDTFGDALGRLTKRFGPIDAVIPAVPHLADEIRQRVVTWPILPRVVEGEAAKYAAMRQARAALAASGTVTLELALAGVPTVVAYKIDPVAVWIVGALLKVETVVLANLVIGEHIMPEYLQWHATPDNLGRAMAEILSEGPGRDAQVLGLAAAAHRLRLGGGEAPSDAAARVLLDVYEAKTGRRAPRS